MAQGISCEGRCGLRPELDFRGMGESAFGGWCRDKHVPLSGPLSGGTRSLVLDREPALSGRRKGLWSAVLLTILIPAWLGCPRELGTTYGMRAQDAIGWMPRRFRFLSTVEQWKRARELYGTVMPGARCGAGSDVADRKLLETVGGPGWVTVSLQWRMQGWSREWAILRRLPGNGPRTLSAYRTLWFKVKALLAARVCPSGI